MQIRVLGCSGGIGAGLRTTSILVDDDTLIDTGTGVGDLTIDELRKVRNVFLTHSHLDHIAGLPLFIDTVFDSCIGRPISIYAREETVAALKDHIFNDVIWPDFGVLPTPDAPVLRYHVVVPGESVDLGDRRYKVVDVHHSVPSVGYCIEDNGNVLAFSGDTTTNETLWPALNSYENLEVLIIEVSFPNSHAELAKTSGHYTPSTFAADLQHLKHTPDIWVTAMKPGEEARILEEIRVALPDIEVNQLKTGDIIVV